MAFSVSVSVKDNQKGSTIPWTLNGDINGKASLEDFLDNFKEGHLRIAKEVLREEQQRGFEKNPRVRTDNIFDRKIQQVKPLGKIEFFAKIVASEAIIGVYDEIERRTPRGDTGLYARSNYVLHNGRLIAINRQALVAYLKTVEIQENDKIRFINTTPYARRLELAGISKSVRGLSAGRNVSRKRKGKSKVTGNLIGKPNGAYTNAMRSSRSKYKAVANFMKFQFLHASAAGVKNLPTTNGKQRLRTSYKSGGKFKTSAGRPYLYPTITIWFSAAGLKSGSGI